MSLPRYNLAELILATLFIGLFVGLAVRTWGGWFFVPILFSTAILFFLTYLLILIMLRQHYEKHGR